jgi:phosphohistidine phosphatase
MTRHRSAPLVARRHNGPVASEPQHRRLPLRRLIVMRHSKTEAYNTDDRSRRLTDRGVRDAIDAGEWLASQQLVPDEVLVSPAVRAQQTAEQVLEAAGSTTDVTVLDDLYGADADEVIDLIHEVDGEPATVLVVGHNPTMEELAYVLEADAEQEWPDNLPTSGVVVLDVPTHWRELDRGVGTVVARHVGRG